MKTGIVLEGGAMRGIFTAGVLDVLMEREIRFDGAAGVSAGVTFGCNLKSLQIGRTLRYNKKYCRDKRYASLSNLLKTGDLFDAKFDYEDIPERLDPFDEESFRANPMEFWAVATDMGTGRPVYHELKDGGREDVQWIRASASMPLVSNPVYCTGMGLTSKGPEAVYADGEEKYREIDCSGIALSDGGTSDSVPVRFFEDRGYERIVVICTQPAGYRKKKNGLLPLLRVLLRSYPMLLEALQDRHLMYNATMDHLDALERETPRRVLLVRPAAPLGIPRVTHDPNEIQRVYDIGRAEGIRRAEEIREFLLH